MINNNLGQINKEFETVENQLNNEINSYLERKYDLDANKTEIIVENILDTIYDLPDDYKNKTLEDLTEEYIHEPQYTNGDFI